MLLAEIERRCRQDADTPVVLGTAGAGDLTGAQLLKRADAMGERLHQLEVRAGERVAVSLLAGGDLLATVIAVWRIGASFVPVGIHEAPLRRGVILADSGAVAFIGTSAGEQVQVGVGATPPARALNPAPELAGRHSGDEAYVLYTSGSSGVPKGVSVPHTAIGYYITTIIGTYGIASTGMLIPSQLPVTFDAALTTLLLPLVTGNVLLPIPADAAATRDLAGVLRHTDRSVLVKTTPSQLRLLGDILGGDAAARLRGILIIGGESLDYTDLGPFRNSQLAIWNEYGPTEATVGCVAHRVRSDQDSGPVPIGKPLPGTMLSLVLADGDTAGEQAEGELVITGPGVASGYLNAPGSDGFSDATPHRSYRTGDRVRRDADGRYHYLGRLDDQVKINGYRVELGEVDHAVRAAAGTAVAVHHASEIVAVVQDSPSLNLPAVQQQLRQMLPPHMRPSRLHVVEKLPATAHGKTDRAAAAALLSPTADDRRGAAETAVSDIWSSILQREISAATHFFDAGGSSFSALVMTGQVAEALEVPISAGTVFDHPVLRDFAAAVIPNRDDDRNGREPATTDTTPANPHGTSRAPSATQLSILGGQGLHPRDSRYCVVSAITVSGTTWDRLQQAVVATITRYDILCWRFGFSPEHDIIAFAQDPPAVQTEDLSALPGDEADSRVAARLAAERQLPIDLLAGAAAAHVLLWRLPRRDGRDHAACALVAHHAVVDEASTHLFWSEIAARSAGGAPPVSRDTHYALWARASVEPSAKQRARDTAARLTSMITAGPIGVLQAFDAPDEQSGTVARGLAADSRGAAQNAARRLLLPVETVLQAAAVAALAEIMTRSRFLLAVPATRRRTPLDFAAGGCYVTTVTAIAEVPPDPGDDWIRAWHRSMATAAQHSDASPEDVAAALRQQGHSIPTVSLIPETELGLDIAGVTVSSLPPVAGPAKHDLSVFVTTTGHRPDRDWRIRVTWRPSRFGAAHAERLLAQVEELLHGWATNAVNQRPDSAGTGDLTATADQISKIVSDLLDQTVASDSDVFAAGAQSIELLKLCRALEDRFHRRIDLVDVFDHPTPAALARLLPTLPQTGS